MQVPRESTSLGEAGRERIKRLEVETSQPLRNAVRDGVESGLLRTSDPDLVAYNQLLAHAWALTHLYFEKTMALQAYTGAQMAFALSAVVAPKSRRKYAARAPAGTNARRCGRPVRNRSPLNFPVGRTSARPSSLRT
ncbi:hypothetical protein [Nocardioides marmoribigeumensis]|uniref:Uncharacterized protein n=1 Tax=Nocardioides marmoribigeumensis TaxID=433649 RepID=A0ABU2BXP5_9ACTN|nr:hypothetical protein [Nocardioides marmoribigeumensis]MDR7363162.1 hypothetical protein [Nocardioides marmoribigeumensis]